MSYMTDEIFANYMRFAGYVRLTGKFKLQPQRRGLVFVNGTLDECERAVRRLRQQQTSSHLTPKKIKRFFNSWATMMFMDMAGIGTLAALSTSERIRKYAALANAYDPSKSVAVIFELIYNINDNDAFYTQCLVHPDGIGSADDIEMTDELRYALGTNPAIQSNQISAGFDREEVRQEYAHLGLERLYESLKQIELTGTDRNTPESIRAAEEILSTNNRVCIVCQTPTANRCSGCKMAFYCAETCARQNWHIHRRVCRQMAFIGRRIEAQASGVM
jgi:hypothetical protein